MQEISNITNIELKFIARYYEIDISILKEYISNNKLITKEQLISELNYQKEKRYE